MHDSPATEDLHERREAGRLAAHRDTEIEAMVRTLETLADHCHGDDRPDCPIIEGLAEEGEGMPRLEPREPRRFGRSGGQSTRQQSVG